MIITVISVLASVGVGALIFYWASRRQSVIGYAPGYAPVQYLPPPRAELAAAPAPAPDLGPIVDQIRAHIRAGNAGTPGEAGAALALLQDAEARYGTALSAACDPAKLHRLIERVRAKSG